jgi:APA family basic amino acid/polyamine antiporter
MIDSGEFEFLKGKNMSSGSQVGLFTATSLVLGSVIGSGVYLLPSSLAMYGPLSFAGWVITAMGIFCIGMSFAQLSRKFPESGGPYTYARSAFGEFVGFQVAWSYWFAAWSGNAAIALTFTGYMSYFFPFLNADPLWGFGFTAGTLWLLTFINTWGVKEAAFVQLVTTILKVIPLAIITLFGLFYVNVDYFTPINPSGEPALDVISGSVGLTLWAFIGIEAATIAGGNIKNPTKNIPRATLIGTLIVMLIYLIYMISVMGIVPRDVLMTSSAPFVDAVTIIFGPAWGWFVAFGGAIACFGALNGWILLQGQMPMAAARDGLFPKVFGYANKKDSPVFGLIISSVLVTLLLMMKMNKNLVDQYTFVVKLGTLAVVLPYLSTSAAHLYFWLRGGDDRPSKGFPLKDVVIALIGLIYMLWATIGLGLEVFLLGVGFLVLGIPLFMWLKCRKRLDV